MKAYNPKDWIGFIFSSRANRLLIQMNKLVICIIAYSFVVIFLLKNQFHLSENHPLKNLNSLQSLLGFAISILLVFRTNTAYDRWWEGRKIWGNLVNSSRNLAIKLNSFLGDNQEAKDFCRPMLAVYPKALTSHLLSEDTRVELDENTPDEFDIVADKHIPNQIASALFGKINQLYKSNVIDNTQFLILNQELTNLTDICGACERIKNTPIPFSYAVFIKKILFYYVITMPIGLSFSMGYFAIPITVLVFYVLVGLELVAEEVEDPFSGDENDIPMMRLADKIKLNIEEIMSK